MRRSITAPPGPEDLGRFDVIVDLVGTDLGAYQAQRRQGRMVALAFDAERMLTSVLGVGLRAAVAPRRFKLFSNNPSPDRIAELTHFAETDRVRPVIDAVFPMADIAEAHRRLEAGGVRGKYVIDMERERPAPATRAPRPSRCSRIDTNTIEGP
ncbi:hypothetical protein SRIMM317S_05893 [Streptomyces rimosus subsp. rimosus]